MSLQAGLAVLWPPALWLVPLVLVAAWWLEQHAGRRGSMAWRMLLVSGLGLGLARPVLVTGVGMQVVLLVDRSGSVAPAAEEVLAELALPGQVGRLSFGDEGHTPLAEAIDLATRALPRGGRILIASDGLATTDGAPRAAARARARGVRVDGLLLPTNRRPDVAITGLEVPLAWRLGEEVPVAVTLRSTRPVTATVRLEANGHPVAGTQVAVPAVATLALALRPGALGDVTLRAVVEAPGDEVPGNNVAYGVVHIAPPPRVVVVGDGAAAVGLADRLKDQGLQVTVLAPQRIPVRLSALAVWDALVLVDVPAAAMGVDQLAALQAFVADLGRGVVMVGGRQSYLAGGWENTSLAAMAPVDLAPPPRGERGPVAVLLLIDQSASMGGEAGRGITKLDLAREAAILTTEVLHPGDQLGVVAYDDQARWLVELGPVGAGRELASVEEAIGRLVSGGGTRILGALELGLPALAHTQAIARHAVLVTDGRDFSPERARYEQVIGRSRTAGVTLSAIAVGPDADTELLAHLAQLGRGRYHRAEDPADLPRLAVQESEIVRAQVEQRGAFRAVMPGGVAHPVLAGIDLSRLPQLEGYLATSARPGAALALVAPNGDPLLATWNYGLGRVAAWTSDAGQVWTASWRGAGEAARLWARLVRYVARAPEVGQPGVDVAVTEGAARITVDGVPPAVLLSATVVVTTTAGAVAYQLAQVAPGRYEVSVPVVGEGAYPAAVRLVAEGQVWELPAGWSVNYPPELRPRGNGEARLQEVVAAGGGRMVDGGAGELAVAGRHELGPWLVVLAALMWPLEVAGQLRLERGRGEDERRLKGHGTG